MASAARLPYGSTLSEHRVSGWRAYTLEVLVKGEGDTLTGSRPNGFCESEL